MENAGKLFEAERLSIKHFPRSAAGSMNVYRINWCMIDFGFGALLCSNPGFEASFLWVFYRSTWTWPKPALGIVTNCLAFAEAGQKTVQKWSLVVDTWRKRLRVDKSHTLRAAAAAGDRSGKIGDTALKSGLRETVQKRGVSWFIRARNEGHTFGRCDCGDYWILGWHVLRNFEVVFQLRFPAKFVLN